MFISRRGAVRLLASGSQFFLIFCFVRLEYMSHNIEADVKTVRNMDHQQLVDLLDIRGLSHEEVNTVSSLKNVAHMSGYISLSDLYAIQRYRQFKKGSPYFHVFKQMHELPEHQTDNKKHMWFIFIIQPKDDSVIENPKSLQALVGAKVAAFGCKLGVVYCEMVPDYCYANSFTEASGIVVTYPNSVGVKNTIMQFTTKTGVHDVMGWIHKNLKGTVKSLKDINELSSKWRNRVRLHPLEFILFSPSVHLQTPLMLVSLSIEFHDRIRFWRLNLDSIVGQSLFADLLKQYPEMQNRSFSVQRYFLLCPERAYSYGRWYFDSLSADSLRFYLSLATPDTNDVFVWGLYILNFVTLMEYAMNTGGVYNRLWCYTKVAFRINLLYLSLVLPTIGLFSFYISQPALSLFAQITRFFGFSELFVVIRNDVFYGYYSWSKYAVSYSFLFCSFYYQQPLYFEQPVQPSNEQVVEELVALTNEAMLNPQRVLYDHQRHNSVSSDSEGTYIDDQDEFDAEVDMMIRLSATSPSLWIPQLDPEDVIKELHQWECSVSIPRGPDDTDLSSSFTATGSDSDSANQRDVYELFYRDWPAKTVHSPQCSVCLGRYRRGARLCALPCGHVFHYACVLSWLSRSLRSTCPMCSWPPHRPKPSTTTQHSTTTAQ